MAEQPSDDVSTHDTGQADMSPHAPLATPTSHVMSEDANTGTTSHNGAPRSENTEMSPREALEILQRGEELQRVCVVGLRLKGDFVEPVRMRHVELVNPQISKATFACPVEIVGSTVHKLRIERNTEFCDTLVLSGSTISNTTFRDVTVKGMFRCEGTVFKGRANFRSCHFGNRLAFWEADFGGWANFRNCTFDGEVDFRTIEVAQGMGFEGCTLNGNALFRGAALTKKLDFGSSRVNGLLDLAKAKLHDYVYLEGIIQGEKQQFAFANAMAERIRIRPEQIEGRLKSECDEDHAAAMQEYGLIKRSYEAQHQYEEDDWAFYRFKVNQRLSREHNWKRPWTVLARTCDRLFLDLGCGYGTNPTRAVVSAVLIMLLFAAVYAAGSQGFARQHPLLTVEGAGAGHRLLFGLVTSVSVFTAGFTGDHLHSTNGWMLVPLATEALMGTLLWGLFIVAFSRKVIR